MPVQQPLNPLHDDLVRYFTEREHEDGGIILNAEDVAALRSTNRYITIFWTHGTGYMRVVREVKQPGYPNVDTERYIPVRTEMEHGSPLSCTQVVHTDCGDDARAWHTIAGSLRKGDVITVRWFANNSNKVNRDMGITEDQCWFEVWPQGNQDRRKVYLIDKWVGRVEDQFRMCVDHERWH